MPFCKRKPTFIAIVLLLVILVVYYSHNGGKEDWLGLNLPPIQNYSELLFKKVLQELEENFTESSSSSSFLLSSSLLESEQILIEDIWKEKVHRRCRSINYFNNNLSQVNRQQIFDNEVPWSVNLDNYYSPPDYTSAEILNASWADKQNLSSLNEILFNAMNNGIDRRSFMGNYEIVTKGQNYRPRNPMGRTGLEGRGKFGKWGPNHAADPIISRWKRFVNGSVELHNLTGKPILQFVTILRSDAHEWAIPGGMVDVNENVSDTLWREFMEEAMDSNSYNNSTLKYWQTLVQKYFFDSNILEIYQGYVDDPRNTDNAWLETVVRNFHDENGQGLAQLPLRPGDGAADVKWMDIEQKINLFANEWDFVMILANKRKAHW